MTDSKRVPRGILVESPDSCRVVLVNGEDILRIHKDRPYGKSLCSQKLKPETVGKGDRAVVEPVVLSAFEALHLVEKGLMQVWRKGSASQLSLWELEKKLRESHEGCGCGPSFKAVYMAFSRFVEEYYVVQSSAYGGHLLLYEQHPDLCHSRYVVYVMDYNQAAPCAWNDVTTAMRVAHNASKELVLVQLEDDEITVTKLERFTT